MIYLVLMMLPLTAAGCIIFNKKVHETLPAAVFISVLGTYVFALFTSLTAAFFLMCAICVIAFFSSVVYMKRAGHSPAFGPRHAGYSLLPHMGCLVAVCALLCALMAYRRVYFYDDLSYWAIYTKNLFAINKLPTLFENCTVDYKDYTPVIQILQYMVMFERRSFSEPSMFRTNVCLIYVLLLPLLGAGLGRGTGAAPERAGSTVGGDDTEGGTDPKKTAARRDKKSLAVKAAVVILYVIFPHVLSSQFYYRLGVDLLMALTFGHILFYVFMYEKSSEDGHDIKDEIFRLVCMASALAFLTLIKSSGPVLAVMAVIMYAVYEGTGRKERAGRIPALYVNIAVLCAFTLGSYLSWQWFLRRSWNNGYLSDRVRAGVTGHLLSFPAYTKEVVLNYIRHFFTYPLTREDIGVTAFMLVLFVIAVHAVLKAGSGCDPKDEVRADAIFIPVMTGLVIFAAAHLSMYLFIFDEWEAHGLMEFDRYITQYLGGVFMLYTCLLVRRVRVSPGRTDKAVLFISTAVFLILLPYGDICHYLIPSNYKARFQQYYADYADSAEAEWQRSGIAGMGLLHDGSARLTIVADAWDSGTQFLEYEAVPQPFDCIINTSGIEEGKLNDYIGDHLEAYVYVCENAKDAYKGDWDESAGLTRDHEPLVPGTLYRVIRENDTKTLVVAK